MVLVHAQPCTPGAYTHMTVNHSTAGRGAPWSTRVRALWAIGTVCVLLLSGCGGGASSTAFDTARAQTLLDEYVARTGSTGGSAAIVRTDGVRWAGATGMANTERELAARTDTVYLIASVSKTVTAVAVMQLVEDGTLDLDTDINRYVPFPVHTPTPTSGMTMRHLLTHTSGIVDEYYAEVAATFYATDADPTLPLLDFCHAFFTPDGTFYNPATFASAAPGTQHTYSNLGITLAGCVVEHMAGASFADVTERRIFAPLDMRRTSWRVADFHADEMAMPYGPDGGALGHYTFADYPNGGLRTTVEDLARFLRAFMGAGTLDTVRMLQPATVREMQRMHYPQVAGAEQQGLGWTGYDVGDGTVFGHVGGEAGVTTVMAYDQATTVGVIVFTNSAFRTEEDVEALRTVVDALADEGAKP